VDLQYGHFNRSKYREEVILVDNFVQQTGQCSFIMLRDRHFSSM